MDGRSPLSLAAGRVNEAIVRLLLNTSKVEVDSRDNYGRSPLWWTIEAQNYPFCNVDSVRDSYRDIARLLLNTGNVESVDGLTELWGEKIRDDS